MSYEPDAEPQSFTFSPEHPVLRVRAHTLEIHSLDQPPVPGFDEFKLLMLNGSDYSQTGTTINRERLGELIGFLADVYLDWGGVPE